MDPGRRRKTHVTFGPTMGLLSTGRCLLRDVIAPVRERGGGALLVPAISAQFLSELRATHLMAVHLDSDLSVDILLG